MNTVELLIKFYKERGISLEKVIDDPIFKGLPVEKQVAALKQHAAAIQNGMKPTNSTKTIFKSVGTGILGGLTATTMALAAKGSSDPMDKIFGRIAGIGLGGIVGGIAGATKAISDRNLQNSTNKYLGLLAGSTPADFDSIRLLSTRGTFSPSKPIISMEYIGKAAPGLANVIKQDYNKKS